MYVYMYECEVFSFKVFMEYVALWNMLHDTKAQFLMTVWFFDWFMETGKQ